MSELCKNVTPTEENAIFYVSGFAAKKFLKIHNCEVCKQILVDTDKLLTGEHKLFTYFKQSDNIDFSRGLLFVNELVFDFLKKVEVIHNECFAQLLSCKILSHDIINTITESCQLKLLLCSEESSNLFLTLFIRMRCNWAVRFENRNKQKKVNSNNQKLKNMLHE